MNSFDEFDSENGLDKFVDFSFDLSDRIQEILDGKGMTHRDLAEIMGKKESQVSKWFSGMHNLTIKTIKRIEHYLDAPIIQIAKPAQEQTIEHLSSESQPHVVWTTLWSQNAYKSDATVKLERNRFVSAEEEVNAELVF